MADRVVVHGLKEVRAALREMGKDMPKVLREALRRVGAGAALKAQGNAPRATGRLAGSIKAYPKATSVGIGTRKVYGAVHEFGGVISHAGHGHKRTHRIRIAGKHYTDKAVVAAQPEAIRQIEVEVQTIAAENGWKAG